MLSKSQFSFVAVMLILFGYILGDVTQSESDSTTRETTAEAESTSSMTMPTKYLPHPTDQPIPSVEIVEASQGKMGEFNVQLALKNFTFTPALVDTEPIFNEGHAHMYVNDTKAGRIYDDWVYINKDYFTPGRNKITVMLSGNDHSIWTVDEAAIETSILVEYETPAKDSATE